MKENWTWKDYGLLHGIAISFDDYRIKAYGRDEEIKSTIDDLATYAKKSTRMLCKLQSFWGVGKSTYLYNVCFNVNERLFFNDEIEQPKDGNFTHVLAFFEKIPEKRVRLLEPVYNEGLPWIWDENTTKNQASDNGGEAWKACLRKLIFIILRRAVNEIKKRQLEEGALAGSKLRKDIYQDIIELGELNTASFIKKLDEMYKTNDQLYEECGELMRFYFRMLLPSMEIKKGNRKVITQEKVEQLVPQLLYGIYSNKFLSAYSGLFSLPDLDLRYFPAFERILKAAQTFLLVVFDEVEDWSAVVQKKIDDDIHDIVVDAESPISLFLIFRTEVLRNIKSTQMLGTFLTILDRLENMPLCQLDKDAIIALTAGVLDTAREGKSTIFPFSEGFILKLATVTKRGKTFNVRTYLRALKKLLDESREWKREMPELSEDLLDLKRAEEIVKEAIKAENEEANKIVSIPKRFVETM